MVAWNEPEEPGRIYRLETNKRINFIKYFFLFLFAILFGVAIGVYL